MNNTFYSDSRSSAGPNREQNLLIGISKHLYFLKDGSLKYQQKIIDERLPGNKRLITRFVLLDVDTGTVYGECHEASAAKDLIGFLARAWAKKPNHPMRGFPGILNTPKIVRTDSQYAADVDFVLRHSNLQIGDLPSGFTAGIHAVKQFDTEVKSLIWGTVVRDMPPPDIFMVQACSALVSANASNFFSYTWQEKWNAIEQPSQSFFDAVDKLYESIGAWRDGPYDLILNGMNTDTSEN